MRTNGFIPLRRGLFEHLEAGRMTEPECLTYIRLIALADPATGVWMGNAAELRARLGGQVLERQIRRRLEGLEQKGYIKRFARLSHQGHGPILVARYELTTGPHAGKRLDAQRTTDWRQPQYEAISAVSTGGAGTDQGCGPPSCSKRPLSGHIRPLPQGNCNYTSVVTAVKNLDKEKKTRSSAEKTGGLARATALSERKRNIEARNNRIAREVNAAMEAHAGSREPLKLPTSLRQCEPRLQAEILRLAAEKRLPR